MLIRITTLRNRRAAVAPMAALLMTFMVGMLTFSIDIGYICSVQAELQDAADAAALAGAAQLQTPFVAYYAPGQTNQQAIYLTATGSTDSLGIYPSGLQPPTPTAQQYAAYNQAGGVYLNVPASDVTFSFYDGATFSAPSYAMGLFPNTINVTTRRDNVSNGSLGLFFGQIFGISTVKLTATASATIFNGLMTSGTTNPPYSTSGTSSATTSTIR
jgi:Flp pilus assembly protein TadG